MENVQFLYLAIKKIFFKMLQFIILLIHQTLSINIILLKYTVYKPMPKIDEILIIWKLILSAIHPYSFVLQVSKRSLVIKEKNNGSGKGRIGFGLARNDN